MPGAGHHHHHRLPRLLLTVTGRGATIEEHDPDISPPGLPGVT
jgi:hypothetical protein